jgi:hypothetical protein
MARKREGRTRAELKEDQEKSTTTMKPNEVIDMKKYEEKGEEIVVPIINENENKEETPASP